MSAVEGRLAVIEARFADAVTPEEGQEHATACASARDVRPLTAALRAVLALVEETRPPAPDGDGSILGGRVSATRLYAAIARELTP